MLLHPGDVTTAELAGHLVALLFAAAGPLSPGDAARLLDCAPERLDEVCELLDREPPTGLTLQRLPDRLQLITAPSSAAVVERYLGAPPPVRLSRAALEALAVIAYRGPATRGDIDSIRGVNSDSAVTTLLGRNLISEVARRESVGRPALLAITPDCLQYLGLRSLEELPPLPESMNGQISERINGHTDQPIDVEVPAAVASEAPDTVKDEPTEANQTQA